MKLVLDFPIQYHLRRHMWRIKPTQRWFLAIKGNTVNNICENGVGIKKKPPKIRSSMKAWKKFAEIATVFSEHWKLNKGFRRALVKKTGWISVWPVSLWCFSYPSPILLLFLSGSLGNQQPVIMVKISKLAALGGGRMGTPFKVSFPENCHYLIVWGFLGISYLQGCLY